MRQVEAAGEQARLFNARELLFEREITDYQQLSNIKKKFEPYFQLWDTSERWLSASAAWHESPCRTCMPMTGGRACTLPARAAPRPLSRIAALSLARSCRRGRSSR